MNYQITLDGNDVAMATEVGTRRNQSNIYWGSENKKVSKRSDVDIHISGFAGEVAFARITEHIAPYSCEIDLEDTHNVEDTRIGDVTVDVKTFGWEKTNLLVPAHKNNKDKACEIYVLMTGSLPTFTMRGWIPGKELFATEPVRYPTKILNHNIPQASLRDPRELLKSTPAQVRLLLEE